MFILIAFLSMEKWNTFPGSKVNIFLLFVLRPLHIILAIWWEYGVVGEVLVVQITGLVARRIVCKAAVAQYQTGIFWYD